MDGRRQKGRLKEMLSIGYEEDSSDARGCGLWNT